MSHLDELRCLRGGRSGRWSCKSIDERALRLAFCDSRVDRSLHRTGLRSHWQWVSIRVIAGVRSGVFAVLLDIEARLIVRRIARIFGGLKLSESARRSAVRLS